MPYLLHIDANAVQKEWELRDFPVTIGRQDGCTIVFNDSRVSRRHAEIHKSGDDLILTDLQSTHLTLVNDRPIQTHTLQHGDHVCLGAKIDMLYLASPDDAVVKQYIDQHREVDICAEESAYATFVTQQFDTALSNLKGKTQMDQSVLTGINQQIGRAIEELKCLYEVGQAVNSEVELAKVLQLIIKHVLRATGGERGIILFHQAATDELAPVIARDATNTLSVDERNRFSRSIARRAFDSGQAVVSKDTLQDPTLTSKSVVDFNIRSAICAPLIAKGRPLGVLYVDAKENMREFSPRDCEFFSALANQSAIAIENARLLTDLRHANQALEHKVRELQALYEVSQSLIMVNDLDTILAKILDSSIEVIGSQRGSIMLFEEGGDELVVRVVRGQLGLPDAPPSSRVRLKRGEGVAGRVVQTGEGVIANAGSADPNFARRTEREADVSHLLCVPLKTKNESIGCINLVNKKDGLGFTDDDLKLLTSLSSQAAVTIENFRLYHLAVFDGLTNLHVHRYFQGYLGKEFEKARRYDSELSLILTDIDHFKSFNDTYGHQIGDIVLIEVARIFKETARTTDLVARYGGEEFAAVLPETGHDGAEIFAERFRKAVEDHRIEVKGQTLSVTISVGVANVKGSGAHNKDELIKFADSALYQAKHGGRNRFCTYRPPLSSRELAERVARRKNATPPPGAGA